MFNAIPLGAAMLWSGVALAANPSATLSVQIIPANPGNQVVSVTLTNGPPNIPNASPCTTTSCAWIGAGWPSGTHVSLVYADLTPISSDYTGTFSLAGIDAASFSISTASAGYTDSFNSSKSRSVGEIKTSGVLSARDYSINVCAGATCQPVTVHAASGTSVACGAGIPTGGTVILAPNCTYSNVSLSPAPNTIYIGAGNGSTIFDGGSQNVGISSSGSGVSVIGIQFQGYSAPGAQLEAGVNYVVRNSRFINSATDTAIDAGGSGSQILNNYVNNIGYSGIEQNIQQAGGGDTFVIGNEVSNVNQTLADTCFGVSTTKITDNAGTRSVNVHLLNNYYHDNPASGPWSDFFNGQVIMSGNTIVRGGLQGNVIEQSRSGWTIDHNVYVHNADGSAATALSAQCGGESFQGPAIAINGSANVNVHDNNISALTATKTGSAFQFWDELGNGSGFVGNNTLHDNTVNFFVRSSASVWGWLSTGEDTSGSSSNNNHFHLIGGDTNNDAHWFWFNQGDTAQTWANYRNSGQDANSTIDTTNTSTPGCTHVACSGSGVGAGGVPF